MQLSGKARSTEEEGARPQKTTSPLLLLYSQLDVDVTLTQLRDAPHAGGQEGLLQCPELQLRIGIRSLIMAQRPTVVGTEVCRQGEDTCGGNKADRSPQERSKAPQAMALPPLPARAGSVSNLKAPVQTTDFLLWTVL